MAYFTSAQADTFFTSSATEPEGWAALSAIEKGVLLEAASARFDALPWTEDYDTEAERTGSVPVTAAFYEYVRYIAERGGRSSQELGAIENPQYLNALADLPSGVAARIVPFLDPQRLGVDTSASVTIGSDTIVFNPAEETPSQAAERYAKAELARAQAGELLTEPEQTQQRPMRAMAFDTGAAPTAPVTPGPGQAGLTDAQVEAIVKREVKDYAEADGSTSIAIGDTDFGAGVARASSLTFDQANRELSITSEDGTTTTQTIPAGDASSGLTQAEVRTEIRSATNAASDTRRGNVLLARSTDVTAGTAGRIPDAAQVKAYADTRPGPQGPQGIQGPPGEKGEPGTGTVAVPSGNTLPAKPWRVGQDFDLLMNASVPNDPLIRYETGEQVTSTEWELPGQRNSTGPRFIRGYGAEWGNPGNSLRGKVFIQMGSDALPANTQLVWYPADRAYNSATDLYQVANAFTPGYQHWWEVTGLPFANTNEPEKGGYHVNLIRDGVRLYPDITVEADALRYAGGNEGQAGWIRRPGVGLDREQVLELIRDNTVSEAITTILDGPGIGLAVTNGTGTTRGALPVLKLFTPAFGLGDASGLVEVEANVHLQAAADPTTGFGAPFVQDIRFTEFSFASTLRDLSAYASNATNGILIGETQVVYSAAQNVSAGTLRLYLGKDADDNLGYWWEYAGTSNGSGKTFTVSVDMVVSFIHQDTGAGEVTTVSTNELSPRSMRPATAGFSEGSIINVGGELLELVPDSAAERSEWQAAAVGRGGDTTHNVGRRLFTGSVSGLVSINNNFVAAASADLGATYDRSATVSGLPVTLRYAALPAFTSAGSEGLFAVSVSGTWGLILLVPKAQLPTIRPANIYLRLRYGRPTVRTVDLEAARQTDVTAFNIGISGADNAALLEKYEVYRQTGAASARPAAITGFTPGTSGEWTLIAFSDSARTQRLPIRMGGLEWTRHIRNLDDVAISSVGQKWATSVTLPTGASLWTGTAIGNVVNVSGTGSGRGWNVEANVPEGVGAFNNAMNISADIPETKPQVNGLWVIAKLNEVEQGRVMMPWGPGVITRHGPGTSQDAYSWTENVLLIKKYSGGAATDAKTIRIRYGIFEPNGLHTVQVVSDGDVPDPNTTLEVWEAGVFVT